MAKLGKRQTAINESADRTKSYSVADAAALVKDNAKAKFDETIEISINLGVDPRHADQMVRGAVAMPNGTGKDVRVAYLHVMQRQMKPKQLVLVLKIWQKPFRMASKVLTV